MKVLFVDSSAEVQQKILEPLRKDGWIALRARNAEDAERMMILHEDGVEALVVNEKFVSFAEKRDLPYVVLTQTWNETQIMKHQNVQKPGFAYLSSSVAVSDIRGALESYSQGMYNAGSMKATGTDGPTRMTGSLSLEDFSDVMKKPEVTRASVTNSRVTLEAPSLLIGGEDATKILNVTNTQMEGLLGDIQLGEPIQLGEAKEFKPSLEATEPELVVEFPKSSSSPKLEFNLEVGTNTALEVQSVQAGAHSLLEESGIEGLPPLENLDDLSAGDLSDMSLSDDLPTELPDSMSPQLSSSMADISQFSVSPSARSMPGDVETLKSYLALREQDVAVLTGQVRSSQERIHQLEVQLKIEKARSAELQHIAQKQEQQIKNFDQDKQVELEVLSRQVDDATAQLKERTDKLRSVEVKLKFTIDEIDKVKERVRVDIRRIRVREKELENQLEILKKDSAALLIARDEKIVELKRKLDLLEFNMELIQEQYNKERHVSEELRNRLKDASIAMRQAGGYLDQEA